MTIILMSSLHILILSCLSIEFLVLAQDPNQFIYNDFRGSNLKLDGIAEVHSDGLLQLTNTSEEQTSHAFNPHALNFKPFSTGSGQSLSFSTHFVFAIVPEYLNSGAGIAFTVFPSLDFRHVTGAQYMGLLNSSKMGFSSNHVFAIELDTVMNPEFGDIDGNHVGINLNSLRSNVSAPVTYFSDTEGVNKSFQLISGRPIQVWIDYNGVEKVLNVSIAPIDVLKPNRSLLSAFIDLSSIFLETMYVGFSSATGPMGSNHYILGWSFNRNGKAQTLELSKLPSLPKERKSRDNVHLVIIVSVVTGVIVLVMTIGTFYISRRKKYAEIHEDWEFKYGPQRFSYVDLYKATEGFRTEYLLGAGGFGEVYRGVLPNSNKEVAVKKVSHDSKQGIKEFVAEIASLGRLRHKNLVQLLGYCRRRGELLLVYDYMPNGSLDKFLFTNEKPNLGWAQRYQILRGVASGLLYLHEEWEQIVLHRDVKASNVVLDADMNGRLGDFGLARLYDHGAKPHTTHVVGTIGYLAPELTKTGRVTTCTDVFSFGAFMLEVACGRRPIQLQELSGEIILVETIFNRWQKGDILEMVDPNLGGDYVAEEMELVLKIGLLCSHCNPALRPSMRQVMQYLDGDALFPEAVLENFSGGMVSVGDQSYSMFVKSFPASLGTESVLYMGR